jgi:hypothetical protein
MIRALVAVLIALTPALPASAQLGTRDCAR